MAARGKIQNLTRVNEVNVRQARIRASDTGPREAAAQLDFGDLPQRIPFSDSESPRHGRERG